MSQSSENIVPLRPDATAKAAEFGAEHDRELLTILFTDLVNSTKLQSELGNIEAARLTELHRKIVREELAKYDAREVEWAGDSCLAVFSKPSDAVIFALRMQAAHRAARADEPRLPLVRVGIHLGEVVVAQRDDGGKKTEDLFGLQVSEAARVMSVARGNQIYCTRAVFDSARGALRGTAIQGVGDVVWVNYGPYALKGSEETVELCEVGAVDTAVLKAPQPSDKVQPGFTGRAASPLTDSGEAATRRAWPVWALSITALLCVAIGAAISAGALSLRRPPEPTRTALSQPAAKPQSVKQFEIDIGPTTPLYMQEVAAELAISPDGTRVAYTAILDGVKRLYVRDLSRLQSVALAGTENSWTPFFSPDGAWIGFYLPGTAESLQGKLMKVAFDGGTPLEICDAFPPSGAAWLDDGTIVFASQDDDLRRLGSPLLSHLFRVSANGGIPHRLTKADGPGKGEWAHNFPSALPGSRALVFTIARSDVQRDIALLRLDTGTWDTMIENAYAAQYAPSGHILFIRDDALWAVAFDPETLEIAGDEARVLDGLQTQGATMPRTYAYSASGTLLYAPAVPPRETRRRLVWVDHAGVESNLGLGEGAYYMPRVSPDGTRVAVSIEQGDGNADLYLHDLSRPFSFVRFTDAAGWNGHPVWPPDQKHLIYAADHNGAYSIWVKRVDGIGGAKLVHAGPSTEAPMTVTPAGDTVFIATDEAGLNWDIGALDIGKDVDAYLSATDQEAPLRMVIQTKYSEGNPSLSPDGTWIAYSSDESGPTGQVYVRPYPNLDGGRWQVSIDGGNGPLWSADGHEIYYRNEDKMMAVSVTLEPTFSAATPRVLFEQEYYRAPDASRQYDLEYPDGKRILMIKTIPDSKTTKLVYVENWGERLEAAAPHTERDATAAE